MNLPPFKLEEFWKEHEFNAPQLLCCSDSQSWSLSEILQMADPEAKKLWEELTLGYTESPGHPLLKKEIASLYSKEALILTLAGAEEGIYCTMRALLEPNDHVAVIEPCYQSLSTLPEIIGATVTKAPQNSIEKAINKNTKLIILNSPHNPTGALIEKELYEKIIALARKNGAYIFSDEVYRYLEIDETKRLPSIADAYEKGIALNVMSKAFGLAGLRIGWIASQDKALIEKVSSYKLYTSICNSAPSEILALIALRSKEAILKRNRAIVLENLKIFDTFIKRHSDKLSWIPPEGGTTALVKLLLPLPVETFAKNLLDQKGILIMPSSCYDLHDNTFRIGLGRKNLESILPLFDEFLN